MRFRPLPIALLLGLGVAGQASAQQPPSFARQVRPFLAKYCLECHCAQQSKGDLSLESFASLMKGGKSGPVIEPGKPDDSRLVLLVERKEQPFMPPKTARQPRANETAVLRAWITAGAKDDSASATVAIPDIKPRTPVAAAISALAYRPDGKLLAAGGHREVVLLDVISGDVAATLPGQTSRVTALAYSRDGKLFAVASGSPGTSGEVRLHAVAANGLPTEKPVHVLTGHKDILYRVAFSPDGKLLATAGYDRVIKLWDTASGKEVRALKDHSDTVYGLAFNHDGRLLLSGAADRAVKVWDVATGTRLYTLSDPTDWVYTVACSPDGKHAAAAGVDRSIRVWEITPDGGKLVHSVFAHEAPITQLVYSDDGRTLYSLSEDRGAKAWDAARMVEVRVYPPQPETALSLEVRPDHKQLALGRYDGALVLLDEATGKPQAQPLPAKPKPATRFPPVNEKEPNESANTGQEVKPPVTLIGALNRAGDVDCFRLTLKTGQQLGVQVMATGSKIEPYLALTDATGRIVAESFGGVLGHTCLKEGVYALTVRDRDYRGGAGMTYHLNVGDLPIITGVFPLGLRQGTEAEFTLEGVNLGATKSVRIKAPADARPGTRLPVTVSTPQGPLLGSASVVVGEFPEAIGQPMPAEGVRSLAIPTTPGIGNGRLAQPGASDTWRFTAKKEQRLIIEVDARRLGSPLDSAIEVLDAKGQPVARAVLRSLARTYTTFRDHDSVTPNLRIEAWNELAVNDHLYIGTELVRVKALPPHPDADIVFFSANGQRIGSLDTTPTHHSAGTPIYKVMPHPPGSTFPPNGFPVFTLSYRNDDGGPGYGKDSRLFFDPPADGEYQVRITDARGQGGSSYAYRLTVRPPRPDFKVSFNPTAPSVWRGRAVPVAITLDRLDGFDGEVQLRFENVPSGFSAPATNILAEENTTAVAIAADMGAKDPAGAAPLKLVARANIAGKEVVREALGGLPKVVDAGDIVTTTGQADVTLKPGGTVKLTVQIERRGSFKGRVPLEVRGLPHGVKVLDIGLNGILVTEKESHRTIELYAESWVKPTERPIVVLARHEARKTEHAAPSVLLRIANK